MGLSDIEIARGVSYLLDQEAIRAVRKMPNWIVDTILERNKE